LFSPVAPISAPWRKRFKTRRFYSSLAVASN
jgi:hypothetical protein